MSAFIAPANHSVIRSSLKEMSDARLVSAAKSGDAVAFVELSARHSDMILRRTYRIVKNWQDAEDVLQDSFMKAFIHLKDFEERASFSSWLTRIAINTALMLLRKKRFHIEISTGSNDDDCEIRDRWDSGIVLKVLKTIAHDESGKSCLREQFKSCRRYSGTLFS
jgi:RNA polymerase sigma-70 factor, ECF subfamily